MKLVRILSLVSVVVAFVGCGSAPQAPRTPVSDNSSPVVATPKDPSLVEGETWSLNLAVPAMWTVKTRPSMGDVGAELLAQTKDDAPVHIGLELVSGPTGGLDEIEFITGVLESEQESGVIRHLQVRKSRLKSGEVAAAVVELREFDDGMALIFEVITSSKSGRGFVVRCGGDPAEVRAWQAACAETLSSFRMKSPVSAPAVKPNGHKPRVQGADVTFKLD